MTLYRVKREGAGRILIHTKREARDDYFFEPRRVYLILIHTKREARDELGLKVKEAFNIF